MTMVTQYNWDDDTWTHTADTGARHARPDAVQAIAAKAYENLPECSGRIERAVQLVLAGDVEVLVDGTARVAHPYTGFWSNTRGLGHIGEQAPVVGAHAGVVL